MVVWSDSVDDIISSTLDLEGRLLKLVWRFRNGTSTPALNSSLSRASMFGSASRMSLSGHRKNTGIDIELTEKHSVADHTDNTSITKEKELEEGATEPAPRPTRIFTSIYIGIAVALATCALCFLSNATRADPFC
jgi:hypothetical protein